MENKKNEDKRIERRIPLHFLIGLNVALLLTLAAFEWKTEDDKIDQLDSGIIVCYFPPTDELIRLPPEPRPKPNVQQVREVKNETTDEEKPPEVTVDDIPASEPFEPGDIDFEAVEIPVEKVDVVYDIVEVEPEYEGGWAAFYKYIGENTRYPNAAKRMNIEGKVYIEFIIEKDGSITNLKVIKPLGGGCDEETIRVLEMLPKRFEPARLNGKPVRKRMLMPFSFTLK